MIKKYLYIILIFTLFSLNKLYCSIDLNKIDKNGFDVKIEFNSDENRIEMFNFCIPADKHFKISVLETLPKIETEENATSKYFEISEIYECNGLNIVSCKVVRNRNNSSEQKLKSITLKIS